MLAIWVLWWRLFGPFESNMSLINSRNTQTPAIKRASRSADAILQQYRNYPAFPNVKAFLKSRKCLADRSSTRVVATGRVDLEPPELSWLLDRLSLLTNIQRYIAPLLHVCWLVRDFGQSRLFVAKWPHQKTLIISCRENSINWCEKRPRMKVQLSIQE